MENLREINLESLADFATRYFHKAPHIAATLVSPEEAKLAKLEDSSQELVAKHLLLKASESSEDGTSSDGKAQTEQPNEAKDNE